MDKVESYLTELSTKIKTRYPEAIIQSCLSPNGELGDVVMDIYLPEEVDEEFALTITSRTVDILLEDDLLIATIWNDSGRTWKRLMRET
jgi:hypothetical protein